MAKRSSGEASSPNEGEISFEKDELEIPPELLKSWQEVVDSLAKIADTPAGLIMKVDPPYIEVFRSSRTEGNPYEVGDKERLDGLYCEEAIERDEKLIVENALKDDKWKDNPDTELGMISYLGYPVKWPSGDPFGTICVLDEQERSYDEETMDLLEHFRELVEAHLGLLYKNEKLNRKNEALSKTKKELEESERKLRQLHEVVDRFQRCMSEEELCKEATDAMEELLELDTCIFYCVEDQTLDPVSSVGVEIEEVPAQGLDGGIAGEVYRKRRTITGENPREKDIVGIPRDGLKSYMSVPIGDLGLFKITSGKEGNFSRVDTELAEIFAGHLNEEVKRIRMAEELKEQAIRDPLSGLYNRRYFNESLGKEVERCRRYGETLAFLMLDVNRFKEVNDRYSHQTGDEVLQEVANLLQSNVRDADTVVRYGGDEFLIMMPETEEVASTVSRLEEELEKWNEESDLLDFPLTLAKGTARWSPDQEKGVEEALKEADEKMYEDKEG